MSNLYLRRVPVKDVCPMCNKNGESTMHALWDCCSLKMARKQWLPFKVSLKVVWKVWAVRNAKIHGGPNSFGCNLVERSVARRNRVVWPKPAQGLYKVICDATIDGERGRIGFGFVIRDSTGFVMAVSSQVMPGNFNAQAAKALAILRGIKFSIDCGLNPCNFEFDTEVVIRWIKDNNHQESMCSPILSDISVLSSELTEVSFSYVPRQGNHVAYKLAKNVLLLEEDRFWMEEYSCYVAREVLVDLSV